MHTKQKNFIINKTKKDISWEDIVDAKINDEIISTNESKNKIQSCFTFHWRQDLKCLHKVGIDRSIYWAPNDTEFFGRDLLVNSVQIG